MSEKRLLIVVPELMVGGAEKQAIFLSKEIEKYSFKAHVLALFYGGKLEKQLRESKIDYTIVIPSLLYSIIRFRGYFARSFKSMLVLLKFNHFNENRKIDFRNIQKSNISFKYDVSFNKRENSKEEPVKRLICEFKPDIVHVHTWDCKKVLKWAFECKVPKIIYTHHNIISVRHSKEEIYSLEVYLRYATNIIFVSNEQKRDFLQYISFPESKIKIITPISGFIGHYRNKLYNDEFIIGTLSNLSPIKGVAYLLDALKTVIEKKILVKLIIGGGENIYIEGLKNECLRLGISLNVIFLGKLESEKELISFFNLIKCFVLPSISEASPIVLIEAMSSGIPVIASKVGGVAELVEDGVTGIIIEPKRPMLLADAIEYLYKNPNIRVGMGKLGYNRYKELFSKNKIITKYVQAYE
jgi:glycosyltransferase involved in cell wall biosynthesis